MEESGHYYTVYLTSLAVGFPKKIAFMQAKYSQLPDEINELDAVWLAKQFFHGRLLRADVIKIIQKALHSLAGSNSYEETNKTIEMLRDSDPSSMSFGFLLHRFGDNWAHRKIGNEDRLYGNGIFGHLCDMHKPDNPWNRKYLFRNYVGRLYQILDEVKHKYSFKGSKKMERVKYVQLIDQELRAYDKFFYRIENDYTRIENLRVIDERNTKSLSQVLRDFGKMYFDTTLNDYRPEDHDTMPLKSMGNIKRIKEAVNFIIDKENLNAEQKIELKNAVNNLLNEIVIQPPK